LLPGCRHKHPYIPPKPHVNAEPPQKLIEIILKGERKPYPEQADYKPPSS